MSTYRFHRRWRSLTRRSSRVVSAILAGIEWTAGWLFAPLRWSLNLLHNRGVNVGEMNRVRPSTRFASPAGWLRSMTLGCGRPGKQLARLRRQGRQGELLYFVPLLIAVAMTMFVGYRVGIQSAHLQHRYFVRAVDAMQTDQFGLARACFERLIEQGDLPDRQALQWALVLQQTGQPEEAQAVIDRLAPVDQPGHGPAHAWQAIALAEQLNREWVRNLDSLEDPSSPDGHAAKDATRQARLDRLAFHLAHADVPDAAAELRQDLQVADAVWKLSTGNAEGAWQGLELAARESPELYLTLAQLGRRSGANESAERALRAARRDFERHLQSHPRDDRTRLRLVETCLLQGAIDDAEATVRAGWVQQPSALLRRGWAKIENWRFDQSARPSQPGGTEVRLSALKQAIQMDPDYPASYRRLIRTLVDVKAGTPEAGMVRQVCESMVTSDKPAAIDHANLAWLEWQAGRPADAQWHLDQAFGLDATFATQARQLARAFCWYPGGDREWSLVLSRRAVDSDPNDVEAALTLAEVHLQQQEFQQARDVLEQVLPLANAHPIVHAALATVQAELGNTNAAEQHRRQAARIRNEAVVAQFQ